MGLLTGLLILYIHCLDYASTRKSCLLKPVPYTPCDVPYSRTELTRSELPFLTMLIYYYPELTSTPQTQVYYAGGRASYSCASTRGVRYWKVNGRFSDEVRGEPYFATENLIGSTSWLYVEASSATNNTEILCLLFNSPHDERASARLMVQGML